MMTSQALLKTVRLKTLKSCCFKKNASIRIRAARGFYEELMVLLRCAAN